MAKEDDDAAQADSALQHARKLIEDQKLTIAKLRADGSDSRPAERLLMTYQDLIRALTS